MRTLIVFALAIAAVAAHPKNIQRIVGGEFTTIDVYPSMAALLFSSGTTGYRQACAGTIINNRSILTAAHCTIGDAPARWQARVGSSYANRGGSVFATSLIINHYNYNTPVHYDNDIAILRLSSTIFFTNLIQPAAIAAINYNLGDNQAVWAVGWGYTTEAGPQSSTMESWSASALGVLDVVVPTSPELILAFPATPLGFKLMHKWIQKS